mmetsp:Transcript_47137/g.156232  ORF Transcript_47137/g.156232 Transcript_47137/m.156232 type:complete len:326 (-) Transcript_47137:171-1148(-)
MEVLHRSHGARAAVEAAHHVEQVDAEAIVECRTRLPPVHRARVGGEDLAHRGARLILSAQQPQLRQQRPQLRRRRLAPHNLEVRGLLARVGEPRSDAGPLCGVGERDVRLDVDHRRAVAQVDARQVQRVPLDSEQPHERQADAVGAVRRAGRVEAGLCAVQPRRAHLRLRRAAAVAVEEPQQPDVREGAQALECVRGVECARRVGGEAEAELRAGGGHDAALARRAILLHERRSDSPDGAHHPRCLSRRLRRPSCRRLRAGHASRASWRVRCCASRRRRRFRHHRHHSRRHHLLGRQQLGGLATRATPRLEHAAQLLRLSRHAGC